MKYNQDKCKVPYLGFTKLTASSTNGRQEYCLTFFWYFTYEPCFAIHNALVSHLITLEVSFSESDILNENFP